MRKLGKRSEKRNGWMWCGMKRRVKAEKIKEL